MCKDIDAAFPWEKAQESPGRKIWNIQKGPELNVITSYGHSALKNIKECVHVHVCA